MFQKLNVQFETTNSVEEDGKVDEKRIDNKEDAESSSFNVFENFTDQPLIPSYQQMYPIESSCQPGTNTSTLLETEAMKSKIESCLFSESEIDLLWGEIENDEVKELEREASDVIFTVSTVEIDTVSTHEPAIEDDRDLVEQTLEEGKETEERGDSVGDEQNCMNSKEDESSIIRKNNTRSILIHGTPQRVAPLIDDMKENAVARSKKAAIGWCNSF
ncbi:hypothetical protein SOVF_122180 [Spinacia oleracea]|nr:hypothetical protein SOVF_122180 [Spinacia oleracea]